MIGQAAVVGQVLYQPVVRIGFQQGIHPGIDDIPVIAGAVLADVLLDADGRDIESGIQPARGGITEERQGGGVRFGLVGGQVEAGMGGRDKGGYGPAFFAKPHLSGEDVNADPSSARQLIKRAAFRQLDPLFSRYWEGIPAAAAGDVK